MFFLFYFKKIKSIASFIFVSYIFLVFSVTFFPIPITPADIQIYTTMDLKNNYIPVVNSLNLLNSPSDAFHQILGNLVMFIPFGFFIMIYINKITKTVAFGFLFSLFIETTQLIVSNILGATYRIFDVDDMILNIIGTLIGCVLYILMVKSLSILKKACNRREKDAAL
jgi:glycopeptide antibiotics resistance protein